MWSGGLVDFGRNLGGGGVMVVRTWIGGGSNSGIVDGILICGLVTVFCIPDFCNQQLWSVLVCSHMLGSSIRTSMEWGMVLLSYDCTTLCRLQKMSTEVLCSRFL